MLKTGLQTSKGPMQNHTQFPHWAKKDRCRHQHQTPVWSKSSPQSLWPAEQSGWGLAGPPSSVQRGHPPELWGHHHAPCTHCQHIATHPVIHVCQFIHPCIPPRYNVCVCVCACMRACASPCVCVRVCVHSCCMHWILVCICKECVSA